MYVCLRDYVSCDCMCVCMCVCLRDFVSCPYLCLHDSVSCMCICVRDSVWCVCIICVCVCMFHTQTWVTVQFGNVCVCVCEIESGRWQVLLLQCTFQDALNHVIAVVKQVHQHSVPLEV